VVLGEGQECCALGVVASGAVQPAETLRSGLPRLLDRGVVLESRGVRSFEDGILRVVVGGEALGQGAEFS